jgi:hypothetical protein
MMKKKPTFVVFICVALGSRFNNPYGGLLNRTSGTNHTQSNPHFHFSLHSVLQSSSPQSAIEQGALVWNMNGDTDAVSKGLLNPKARVAYLRKNFIYFTCVASVNHALSYVVTAYASSTLGTELSSVILGLCWTLNAVSGLTVATPTVKFLGWKKAMIVALAGYAYQIISVLISLVYHNVAWPVAISGSVVAGFTSAVWWTAQGVCFERTGALIVDELKDNAGTDGNADTFVNTVSSDLAAYWTVIYQSSDILVFVSLSIFPIYCGISFNGMILVLSVIGIITTALGFTFDDLGEVVTRKVDWLELKDSIISVPVQFKSDCRVSLLAPFVFGFGITTAMFSYYLNDSVVTDNIGQQYIGFLEGYSYFVATVMAFPYAYVARRFPGGQDMVMQFGSLAFLLSGFVVLFYSNRDLSTWKLIFVVRGFYGLGRGVFEGACRATYANLFKNDELAAAFSGQTLLAGFSGGICFFLYHVLDKEAIAGITVANGLLALLTYQLLAMHPYNDSPIPWSYLFSRTRPPHRPLSAYSSTLKVPLHLPEMDDEFTNGGRATFGVSQVSVERDYLRSHSKTHYSDLQVASFRKNSFPMV